MTVFSQTETAITINGPAGALEARIQAGAEAGALSERALTAIVCHPHPQHGGTMSNKVVTTLVRTYRDLGVATVRFNFRGVGASEGTFDNAVGEVDDLLAVRDWLANQRPDGALLLAGFSFGSAVAAGAVYRAAPVEHLTLIAPPVERYAYDRDGRFPCPVCIAQGERDDVVVPEGVIRWSETHLQSPHVLLRYPQAGHFFHGQLTGLKTDLASTIQRQLGAAS